MYMTTFANSTYVLVRFGARKMKIWVAIVAVVGVWFSVPLPNTAIFSPDVVLINFHDNNMCAAHGTGYKTFIYAFGYTTVHGLLDFTVSVVCPIVTVWLIRHNTISGDLSLVKAMLKFQCFSFSEMLSTSLDRRPLCYLLHLLQLERTGIRT